jgi:hypothetical protein
MTQVLLIIKVRISANPFYLFYQCSNQYLFTTFQQNFFAACEEHSCALCKTSRKLRFIF